MLIIEKDNPNLIILSASTLSESWNKVVRCNAQNQVS